MKYLSILIFIVFGFTQVSAQENAPVLAKVMFTETVSIEDISINFVDVISDSRCPKNVSCIWAGEVKILIAISKEGQLIEKKEVVFSGAGVVNEKDHLLYTSNNLRILCLGILPYPITPDNIPNTNYYMEIQVN